MRAVFVAGAVVAFFGAKRDVAEEEDDVAVGASASIFFLLI